MGRGGAGGSLIHSWSLQFSSELNPEKLLVKISSRTLDIFKEVFHYRSKAVECFILFKPLDQNCFRNFLQCHLFFAIDWTNKTKFFSPSLF